MYWNELGTRVYLGYRRSLYTVQMTGGRGSWARQRKARRETKREEEAIGQLGQHGLNGQV